MNDKMLLAYMRTDCQTVNLSHLITRFYNLKLMGSKLHMAVLEQKLVEQANGVVQNRLAKWKTDTGSSEWVNSLPII